MANSIVAQTHVLFKPLVFGPAERLPEGTLPPRVEVAGSVIYSPVLTKDGKLVVDTGKQVLELSLEEVDVLREVILSWDVALAA